MKRLIVMSVFVLLVIANSNATAALPNGDGNRPSEIPQTNIVPLPDCAPCDDDDEKQPEPK